MILDGVNIVQTLPKCVSNNYIDPEEQQKLDSALQCNKCRKIKFRSRHQLYCSGTAPFDPPVLLNGPVLQYGLHPPAQSLMDHLTLRLPLHPALKGLSFFHLRSPPLPSWTRPFINRVELNGPPQTPATTWERDMKKGGKISRSVRSPSAVSPSTRRASQDQTTRN